MLDKYVAPPNRHVHQPMGIWTIVGTWTFVMLRYSIGILHGGRFWRTVTGAGPTEDCGDAEFYVKRFSFIVFVCFYVFAQVYIFMMPTVSQAAFSVCNQLNTVLGQQFTYSSANYPYPTTYEDIANVGDIYAFIKGPVFEQTVYTSDGTAAGSANTKYYQGGGQDMVMMGPASQNVWAFTGDIRIRQVRSKLKSACGTAPTQTNFTPSGTIEPISYWAQTCDFDCCVALGFSSENELKTSFTGARRSDGSVFQLPESNSFRKKKKPQGKTEISLQSHGPFNVTDSGVDERGFNWKMASWEEKAAEWHRRRDQMNAENDEKALRRGAKGGAGTSSSHSKPAGMSGDPFVYDSASYRNLAGETVTSSCVIQSRYHNGLCYGASG